MKKIDTKKLTVVSLMVALNVVLSRFLSINAWNIKIGFTFVTVFAVAYLLGPIYGAITGALGDLIGALLFPIGEYFPGFTLTAALTGMMYGILLKGNTETKNVLIATIISQEILSLFLNTYWIHVLYNASFKGLFVTRIVQAIILTIVEFFTIKLLGRYMPAFERRFNLK